MADDMSINARSPDSDGSVRRISSETHLNHSLKTAFDSYHILERSQSEVALLKDTDKALGAEQQTFNVSLNFPASGALQNEQHLISESSKVYFDLSNIGSGDDEDYRKSRTRISSSSSMKQSLETIPQNEELILHDTVQSSSDDEGAKQRLDDAGIKIRTGEGSFSLRASSQKSEVKSKVIVRSVLNQSSVIMKSKVRALMSAKVDEKIAATKDIFEMIDCAWSTPVYGRDLAYGLCDTIRDEDGLNFLIRNLRTNNEELFSRCANLLERILTTHNRDAIVQSGLETLIKMTVEKQGCSEYSQMTTGILESLFKHSENTCRRIIELGGLDTLLFWCRSADPTTLRHCAMGLANLAIYGGSENQLEMIKRNAPEWLFPLAFSADDNVRYYACLAICTLAANKEIEASVINSGTMELVQPFIATHTPAEFAKSDSSHVHGRSMGWIMRLIPVLLSRRDEAQTIAAFHFAMEAGIKKEQQKTQIFYDIGAIEPLKKVASSPNALASKLAAETLHILGEEVPPKLTQQVPLWSVEDVACWVSQVGFTEFASEFSDCRVDGDLLLHTSDLDLQTSIQMKPSMLRKRFLRELNHLKIYTDYSSCDLTKLADWLRNIVPEFTQYTYPMVQAGVDLYNLHMVTDDILRDDCKISLAIHRQKILNAIRERSADVIDGSVSGVSDIPSKPIDVFISYRRSTGSQLASLLKVHLQLRGFSVFLDIEKLQAGKFDEGLLNSVKMAKHFVLVLTENSLERCINDDSQKDWIHKEVTAALESGANIIPVVDNFEWPNAETLPNDMRAICFFNAIRWIHDYQEACVDKIESFLRGELNTKSLTPINAFNDSHGNHSDDASDVFDESTV